MWGCRTSSARAEARVATFRLRTTRRPRRARTPTDAASRRWIASSRSSAASPDSRTCRSCRPRGKSACARRIASSARRQSPSAPILTALPANLPPVREWTIYAVKSAHTDIGLHNSQYIQRHGTVRRIDEARRLHGVDHRAACGTRREGRADVRPVGRGDVARLRPL